VAPETAAAPAPAAPAPAAPAPAAEPVSTAAIPSFDIVRVEPDGESVIAGRAAPGATIELLRDGQVHARTAADPSGLFAFVPPRLPPGSHRVTLQAIAPDGTRQQSREAVTIVIAAKGNERPLVTLTSPDRPTVVLSNPEPPVQTAQAAPAEPPLATLSTPDAAPAPAPAQPEAAPAVPAVRPDIKIVSVEAEESGRLFVSGQAAPGATVRLYLNESFIAPGGVGGDGRVSFAIGRGMKPGDYRVRLDDVDPVSGEVRSRAEVAFNIPVQVAASTRPPQVQQQEPRVPPDAPASPSAAEGRPSDWAAQRDGVLPAGTQVASASPTERGLDPGTIVIPDVNTAIVSRGDNLWRISQRIYGQGYRYTVIFGANQGQIRNPDLIYPGQVFVLPKENEPKVP
jgi:nucleoid-associated protein YgaU